MSKRKTQTALQAKRQPCDILILTCSIGSGHLSVAKAIKEAILMQNDKHARVEIIDLLTTLQSLVTRAAKSFYLSSLKISPKIYQLLFNSSSEALWPLKFLNFLSEPFMQEKFRELLEEKHPTVLVSTYPMWNLLIKKIWKKYCNNHPNLTKHPFVSVVTDSISVHNSWTHGNPDHYIVANKDTSIALQKLGVASAKIKTFGYPVSSQFSLDVSRTAFEQKWDLSAQKKTLLLILSSGSTWAKIKTLISKIQNCSYKNLQLVVIATDKMWREKLGKITWRLPTRITGWTDEMHAFVKSSDIVITKAGGATIMECIASKKPVIIFESLPGHEAGNSILVQKYNLGRVLNPHLDDFDEAVEYILNNSALIEKNISAMQKPQASKNTAKFLIKLAKD